MISYLHSHKLWFVYIRKRATLIRIVCWFFPDLIGVIVSVGDLKTVENDSNDEIVDKQTNSIHFYLMDMK